MTVTLNPSVDRTISVGDLRVGSINRAELIAVDPGGKGVNVSRALSAFGADTYAVLVCADLGSDWFDRSLTKLSIPHTVIKADGVTRSNITVVGGDGAITKLNEPGFTLTADVIHHVKEALAGLDLSGAWVVFAGRLNPGADVNTYKDLAEYVRSLGAKIALDGSGPEFKAAMSIKPDLIKPNQFELGELVSMDLHRIDDVIDAARELISQGIGQVLCSLGVDGAILITADEIIHCEPEKVAQGTPVGAGDILLALYLGGGAQPSALKDAIAWSAASVPLEGTAIPTKAQATAVGVIVNDAPSALRELAEVH